MHLHLCGWGVKISPCLKATNPPHSGEVFGDPSSAPHFSSPVPSKAKTNPVLTHAGLTFKLFFFFLGGGGWGAYVMSGTE